MMNRVELALLIILIFLIGGCYEKEEVTLINREQTHEVSQHVSFQELSTNISKYDSTYIETEGIFFNSMEEQSLSDPEIGNNINKHLWLSFNYPEDTTLVDQKSGKHLFSSNFLEKLSNRKILVRGKINVAHKGHLSQYLGSIEHIIYITTK